MFNLLSRWMLAAAFVAAAAAHAEASLLVAPTRYIFEGNARETEVLLVNKGSQPATYRLSFIHNRQLPTGAYERITEATGNSGEQFADALVRFSPRQVRINPGQTQVIRLFLRKPANLATGEYRSHLLFEKVPDAAELKPAAAGDAKKLNILMTMVPGVSIPIIVRHGEPPVAVKLSRPKVAFEPGKKAGKISLEVEREGLRSIYGNVKFFYQASKELAPVELGALNQVSVLAPGKMRELELQFNLPDGLSRKGTYRIEFVSAEPSTNGKVLAERNLTLE